MKNLINLVVQFIKETRAEVKKVVWPERRYVIAATGIILVIVFLTSMYIMVVDFILGKTFGLLLR